MGNSLYSASWYRVADLKPRLRIHVELHRQRFRGALWYVVQDHQTGRFHRLSPAAYHAVCLMDGRRSVDAIWRAISDKLGEEQPTQEDMVRLLSMLHGSDLLVGELPPDLDELALRSERQGRRALLMKLRNPLALRMPLFDPDRLLAATLPLVRPLFSVTGLILWAALVLSGCVVAAMNWNALAGNIVDQAFSIQNVLLMIVLYPAIKAIHEFGHAYATKVWGGEVHEMGVMLLVLVPVPYVDATASSAFREPWRRAVVGGAGILVEAALAAIAIIVWVNAEPGLVRAIAFNVALIGGASTILFNGNPLLRFDGYYVLSDLVGIPNLSASANKYFFEVVQRTAFGIATTTGIDQAAGVRSWLLFYAVASFLYRTMITLTIALFIASKLFFVGIVLAVVTVFTALVLPVLKGIKYLLTSPQLRTHRRRALVISGGAAAALASLLLLVPLPYATLAEGIVWIGENATVRARTDGAIMTVTDPGQAISPAGTELIAMADPILSASLEVLESQRDELNLRLEAVKLNDVVQGNMLREQIRHTEGQLSASRRRLADLTIRSGKDGRFLTAMPVNDMSGRFLKRGDTIGYLVGDDDKIVRVVVPQADVDLIRRRTQRIDIRLVDDFEHVLPATLLREMPAAQAEIPHAALSTAGGGAVVLDPSRPDRLQPLETMFHFDLAMRGDSLPARLGGRVHVRFDHGHEPIAFRMLRGIRQLFLRQFGV
jgi:putative peptide zinc metalloprotease protein